MAHGARASSPPEVHGPCGRRVARALRPVRPRSRAAPPHPADAAGAPAAPCRLAGGSSSSAVALQL
eukprot:scaffold10186_cov31-Tisochrysis_lutea.AAC.2